MPASSSVERALTSLLLTCSHPLPSQASPDRRRDGRWDELADPNTGSPADGNDIRGREALKQFVKMYYTAFPDLRFTVEDQFAEGDKVVTRWSSQGTHKGELMGIGPTGKHVAGVTGISIDHYSGGKFVEGWTNWDTLGLMQQLGVIPALGQPAATRR